jgi:hypothetical protein
MALSRCVVSELLGLARDRPAELGRGSAGAVVGAQRACAMPPEAAAGLPVPTRNQRNQLIWTSEAHRLNGCSRVWVSRITNCRATQSN